jgi:sugar lactone lactonase YvrE
MSATDSRYLAAALIIFLSFISHNEAAPAPLAVILPGDRVFPESMTSTLDGTLYVGSAERGGILRVRPGASKAESWIQPGAFGSASISGVFADVRTQTLWVCSNSRAELSPDTESFLIAFDLRSGAGKLKAKLPGSKTFCGDIAVTHDGDVYVTNSAAPQILKYNSQTRQLDIWLSDPQFQPPSGIGLDGIAAATDGNIYVDSNAAGQFFQITIDDGKPTSTTLMPLSRPLSRPGALRSIFGHAFFLIEGVGRLDRLTVEGSEAIVDTIREGINEPSGVAHEDNTTWVAEGQLSYLFDPSKKDKSPALPFRIDAINY